MGRQATIGTVGLVLLGGLAAGCSGTAEPDLADIDQWIEAQGDVAAEDAVAALASPVGLTSSEPDPANAATLHLGRPADMTGLRLSCFGDESLTFQIEVGRGPDEERLDLLRKVACGDGAHEEEISVPGASTLWIDAYAEEYVGAWHVEMLGEQ